MQSDASTKPAGMSEQILKFALRILGASSLTALVFVVAPHAWMESIHAELGMGRLPDAPVVSYLARSTSAFYALLGGLFWVVSFDLGRYRRVLIYLGAAISLLGVMLLVVDWSAGMPSWWTAWEGPFVIVFGLAILFLIRGVRREPSVPSGHSSSACESGKNGVQG